MVYNPGDPDLFYRTMPQVAKPWFPCGKILMEIKTKSLRIKFPQADKLWSLWGKDLQATESWSHRDKAFL